MSTFVLEGRRVGEGAPPALPSKQYRGKVLWTRQPKSGQDADLVCEVSVLREPWLPSKRP